MSASQLIRQLALLPDPHATVLFHVDGADYRIVAVSAVHDDHNAVAIDIEPTSPERPHG